MSTLPNPLIANYLASANPNAPALGTGISMPNPVPSVGSPVLPNVTQAPQPLTQTQRDIAERDRLINTGSGIDQIKSPLGRGIARAVDITGSVFAPALAQFIPGTSLHHQLLVNQATNNVEKDQAEEQAAAQTVNYGATTRHLNDESAALEAPAAPQYDYTDTPNGKVAIQKGTTTATPVTVNGVPIAPTEKQPTTPFELWHQQNPNGTVDDFNKIQSKPLSAEEAKSLNAVWDGLATKHHLPTGQFSEGMAHADATQLASALNNAIGKQQGDVHITIDQANQAQKAPLNTNDPAMQASVNAVANGSMKLTDVFGRGATTAQKAQFVAAVKQVNPNYNSGDHDIENAVRRDFSSGHDSNTLNAINTAYNHLDKFAEAARALKNGNSKAMNELANAVGVQLQNGASPQVISDLVKQALKGEVSRAFTGAGATVDEQHNLDTSFSNANSLDTMLGVVNETKGLLKGKEQNLRNKYNSGLQGQPNFIDSGSTPNDTPPAGAKIRDYSQLGKK